MFEYEGLTVLGRVSVGKWIWGAAIVKKKRLIKGGYRKW